MKRLLGLTGLTCFAVLTACFYVVGDYALYISIGSFILFLACIFARRLIKDKTLMIVFLSTALAALYFFLFTVSVTLPIIEKYDGVTAEVRAVQIGDSYKQYGYNVYELNAYEINGEGVNIKLKLTSKASVCSEPNDILEFKCELDKTTGKASLSENFFLKANLYDSNELKVTHPEHKSLVSFVYDLRKAVKQGLYMELDKDTADFASAVLIGDKHSLSAETSALLRANGLSHISVVSGLHLSVIVSLCYKILSKFIRKRWTYITLTYVVMLLYAAMTGFNKPVLRSMIMFTFLLIGQGMNRRHDPINSIGAAALILLIINPYSAGNIGMLLSFCATLGIVLWMDKISSFLYRAVGKLSFINRFVMIGRIVRVLTDTVSTSLCAVIWTMPIAILCFGGFSTVTVISNLLTVPFMTVVIVMMALCSVLHYMPFIPSGADACGAVVILYYRWLMLVCSFFEKIPFSYVDADAIHFKLWLALTLLMIAAALVINKSRMYAVTAMLSLLILTGSILGYNIFRQNTVTLRIPDTKNGMTVVLESADGYALLTVGGSRTRVDSLCDYMSRLDSGGHDVLIDTSDKYSDMYYDGLTSAFDYQTILRYDNGSGISREDGKAVTFCGETSLMLWDKALVELIPIEDTVFEYVTVGDKTVLIISEYGDAQKLDDRYKNPDIIVTRGICENMNVLRCDRMIVVGTDYKAFATAELFCSIAQEVTLGTDIMYDIL